MLDISFLKALHTSTGIVVVFSGAMALLLSKGSLQHKLAGRLFVSSILIMGPVVLAGAWLSPGSISSLGILFMFFMIYLVVSAWSTIRRADGTHSLLDILAPFVAGSISIAGLILGYDAVSNPSEAEGIPPIEAYYFFSALAFMAMLLDANHLKNFSVRGKSKIIRHVWRMNCALFFATSTLFTGPGSIIFPDSMRGNPLLLIPQLLVIILALFWIYRLLFSKQGTLQTNISNLAKSSSSVNSNIENQ